LRHLQRENKKINYLLKKIKKTHEVRFIKEDESIAQRLKRNKLKEYMKSNNIEDISNKIDLKENKK
jgi:hypothetical protein